MEDIDCDITAESDTNAAVFPPRPPEARGFRPLPLRRRYIGELVQVKATER